MDRYYVNELSGFGSSSKTAASSFSILDRFDAHREVEQFYANRWRKPRQEAERRCLELNADEAAWERSPE